MRASGPQLPRLLSLASPVLSRAPGARTACGAGRGAHGEMSFRPAASSEAARLPGGAGGPTWVVSARLWGSRRGAGGRAGGRAEGGTEPAPQARLDVGWGAALNLCLV